MECPWCMAEHTRDGRKPISEWSPSTKQQFIDCVNSGNYTSYSIAGGEPLIRPAILKDVIGIIRNHDENLPINVFTNGSLITPDIVNLLNTNNINVTLAVSPNGYKSIDNMVRLSKRNDTIQLLCGIHNLNIRYVYTLNDEQSYVSDMVTLYNTFGCGVECSIDYLYLSKIDVNYLYNLRYNLDDLCNRYPTIAANVQWTLAHMRYCDCTTTASLYANGEWHYIPIYHPDLMYGCTGAMHKMGVKLYNRFCVVLQNFNRQFESKENNNAVCGL